MIRRRSKTGWTRALAWCALSSLAAACGREPPADRAADGDAPGSSAVAAAPSDSPTASPVLTQLATPPLALTQPVDPREPDFARAKAVYRRRCAFCHGDDGDGKGMAAAALWPRPRSFVDEPFRFVSTDNGMPTEADVFAIVSNGMPGSSMPPWRKLLPESDRRELTRYVLWLAKKSLLDKELAKADDRRSRGKDAPSAEEIRQKVEAAVAPGRPVALPPKPPFSRELAGKGAEVYAENCKQCHGARGDGRGQQPLKDSLGRPIRARSYSLGVYKGGYSDEQLARRILAGLPGSPMPAFATALKDPADVWPLVYRVRQFERGARDAPSRGRVLFHQRGCASCHGAEGRGEVPNYNYLTTTVRALNVVAKRMLVPDAAGAKVVVEALSNGTLAALAASPPYPQFNVTLAQYDALTKLVRDGNPAGRKDPKLGPPTFDMPSWKNELSDRQIDEILAYLVTLQPWEADAEE